MDRTALRRVGKEPTARTESARDRAGSTSAIRVRSLKKHMSDGAFRGALERILVERTKNGPASSEQLAFRLGWAFGRDSVAGGLPPDPIGCRLLTSDCVEGRHDECDRSGRASVDPNQPCGCPCHGQFGKMCRACWRSRTSSMDSNPRSRLPKKVREASKSDCAFCGVRGA